MNNNNRSKEIKQEKAGTWNYSQAYPPSNLYYNFADPKQHQDINLANYQQTALKHPPYLGHNLGDMLLHGVFSDTPLGSILEDQKPHHLNGHHGQHNHNHHQQSQQQQQSPGTSSSSNMNSPNNRLQAPTQGQQSQPHTHHQQQAAQPPSQLNRAGNPIRESLSAREERLRKNAERGKMRRMEETEEQRLVRLKKNAERNKLRRLLESPEQRQERLRKNAERQRMRRSK